MGMFISSMTFKVKLQIVKISTFVILLLTFILKLIRSDLEQIILRKRELLDRNKTFCDLQQPLRSYVMKGKFPCS